jgi:peptidyl-prolyl cis-trans isomerase B (cyclophilin B)
MPHRRLLAIVATLSMVAVSALPATAQDERPPGPPEATPNPVALDTPAGDGTAVRVTTELGDFVIGLFNESAPVASENFYNLATSGYYDGVGFHRVASLPGRVLQGGDPDGTGAGGPGYTILDEEVVGQYGRGIVAMARTSEPNSQGSQFFIVLDDAAEGALEAYRTYVIFGRVVEGMDVVEAIVAAREPSNQIADPVRIESTAIEQVELPPEPTPAPPSPAEAAADELAALMPASAAGYDLQQIVFTLEEVGAQFDREVVAELQTLADEAGADLNLMSIAQASAGDEAGFVSIAAASIPGVSGESSLAPVAQLLLPGTDVSDASEETFGDRTTTVVDLGDGQVAHVFASGDVVWFVITTVEDVESIVTALP